MGDNRHARSPVSLHHDRRGLIRTQVVVRFGGLPIVADFDAALAKAVRLARGEQADFLQGWCGPMVR